MINRIIRATLALALIASAPAIAADLKGPEPRRAWRHEREPVPEPDFVFDPQVLLPWRAYGWPGGQAGPCWRLWYGQWVWSC